MINWREHIISDSEILQGKPTIKGTRISVEFILERLASGWSEAEILENYPHLPPETLQAVFTYTHECLKDGMLFYKTEKTSSAPNRDMKFEMFKGKDGKYYFRLKAKDGQIVLSSEGYSSKDKAKNEIESIKLNAPIAELNELNDE